LHHKNRDQEARAALARLRPAATVEADWQMLANASEPATTPHAGGGFVSPAVRLALVAGVGTALIPQITGINAVMYYPPSIFKAAGFASATDALLDDLLLAVLLVAVTFAASRLVDRLGRRRLLLWGLAGMVIGLFVLGAAFAQLGVSPLVP